MAVLYLSAVEFIKKRAFEVAVPTFYHPHLPKDMKEGKQEPLQRSHRYGMVQTKQRSRLPFRQIVDPSQMQRASFTIEIMLDMFQKKIEFEIVNEHDIPEIFDGLDRYLVSIQTDVQIGDEVSVAYAKLVVRWRTELYKHYYRYMQTHPEAKETLYPNNNVGQNLVSLLSMVTGVRRDGQELDPLRARARPPYDIEGSMPTDTKTPSHNDFEVECSLALGGGTSLSDDGKDFDFNDFLKRG